MRCLVFLVAALLAWQPANAEDLQQRHAFAAPVAVAADGRVEVGEVEWLQGKLAEVVRAELGKLPYVRGQVEDGCLRISETTGTIVRRGDRPTPNPHLVPAPALPDAGGHRSDGR